MALADSNSIQQYGFVKEKIADKAAVYVSLAAIRVKHWITAAVYDALESESDEETLVKQAESLMALAMALPQLNMRFSDLGGLSKIIGIPGENTEELMSFTQVKQYQEQLKKTAFELIEALVPELDDDPASFDAGSFSIMGSTNNAAATNSDFDPRTSL